MAWTKPTEAELYKYLDDKVIPFLSSIESRLPPAHRAKAFEIRTMLGKATGLLPDWRDDIRVSRPDARSEEAQNQPCQSTAG